MTTRKMTPEETARADREYYDSLPWPLSMLGPHPQPEQRAPGAAEARAALAEALARQPDHEIEAGG